MLWPHHLQYSLSYAIGLWWKEFNIIEKNLKKVKVCSFGSLDCRTSLSPLYVGPANVLACKSFCRRYFDCFYCCHVSITSEFGRLFIWWHVQKSHQKQQQPQGTPPLLLSPWSGLFGICLFRTHVTTFPTLLSLCSWWHIIPWSSLSKGHYHTSIWAIHQLSMNFQTMLQLPY